MKHILLLGALCLFGATASAQSCTGAMDKKAKTECKKGKASCCAGKTAASTDSKYKKSIDTTPMDKPSKYVGMNKGLQKKGMKKNKEQMAMTPKIQKANKKAKMSPAKD